MATPVPNHELDTLGLYCPEPVMLLHSKIRDLADNEILLVLATDPSTERDIPKFCRFLGHELLTEEKKGEQYHYYIRKVEKG